MSMSYPLTPYPSMTAPSTPPSTIRLLIPLPIPRTPHAPHFDRSRVREFLQLILIHGANAGVTDIDSLVPFIVHYSSDRVREVIRYIPELDPDEPNKTWSAAETVLLNLYGSFDDKPRVQLEELLDFCRVRATKFSLRHHSDIQQYLREFLSIAGPLVKQRDITESERDYYFVSGIPSRMKLQFISRVPADQSKRSNPISLINSVAILRELLDDDFLFPDLWSEPETERAANRRTAHRSLPRNELSLPSTSPSTLVSPQFLCRLEPGPPKIPAPSAPSSPSAPAFQRCRESFRAAPIQLDPEPERRDSDEHNSAQSEESRIYYCYPEMHADSSAFSSPRDERHEILDVHATSEPELSATYVPSRPESAIYYNRSEYDLDSICDLYTDVELIQLSFSSSHPISSPDSESDCDSITDLSIESIYPEQKSSELTPVCVQSTIQAVSAPEIVTATSQHELDDICDLYSAIDHAELSYYFSFNIPFTDSEPESITNLVIEMVLKREKFNEPDSAEPTPPSISEFDSIPESTTATDEYDSDSIYDLYSEVEYAELSYSCQSTVPFTVLEPESITDLFIEPFLTQEKCNELDPARSTSLSNYQFDSSTSSNDNFDEDLCNIFELYIEQSEQLSQTEPSKQAESQPFSLRTSYVHDFVPELLQSHTESHAFIEPTDDPPSYQESALTSEPSFAYARPRIRAESFIHLLFHLSFIALSIVLAVLQRFYSFMLFGFEARVLRRKFNYESRFQETFSLNLYQDLHTL